MRRIAAVVLCAACAWFFAFPALAGEPGWEVYENGRFGYEIEHPDFLKVVQESDNGDGVVLASSDGSCELRVWGSYNVMEDTLEGLLDFNVTSAEERGWKVVEGSKNVGEDSFAVSFRDGEFCVEERGILKGDVTAGFQLRYPASESEKFGPVLERVTASFKIGTAGK